MAQLAVFVKNVEFAVLENMIMSAFNPKTTLTYNISYLVISTIFG